jgi:hypothetical protein
MNRTVRILAIALVLLGSAFMPTRQAEAFFCGFGGGFGFSFGSGWHNGWGYYPYHGYWGHSYYRPWHYGGYYPYYTGAYYAPAYLAPQLPVAAPATPGSSPAK